MVKLTTTLVFLTWSAVAAATDGSPRDREEMIMRKYQSAQVQDRNVDTWYDDFDDTMDDYKSKLYEPDGVTINETMICDFASTLTAQLGLTKQKIQLVKNGLDLTKEQLDDLEVLIEKDEYKDITGLKELLTPYINQHKEKYDANMERLAEEEADIAAKEKRLKNTSAHVSMKSGLIGALVLSLVVEEHKPENEERRDQPPTGETHAQLWDNLMKNYLVRCNSAQLTVNGWNGQSGTCLT